MRKSRTSRLVFVTAFLSATPALAAGSGDSGFELGVRTGYAFSAGHLGAPPDGMDEHVGDYVSGQWPFWIDAGYRLDHSLYLGAFFQYGVGFVNDDRQDYCRNANVDCSASDVRFGVMGRYHFSPVRQASPWLGYGLGWEWGSFSSHQSLIGSTNTEYTWSGWEYANLQVGVDFQLPHRAVIAPFISFSLGEFNNLTTTVKGGSTTTTTNQDLAKTSLHEWIFIGVRIAIMP
jgi:hypothetical protein